MCLHLGRSFAFVGGCGSGCDVPKDAGGEGRGVIVLYMHTCIHSTIATRCDEAACARHEAV
jgi:hypothetical protein